MNRVSLCVRVCITHKLGFSSAALRKHALFDFQGPFARTFVRVGTLVQQQLHNAGLIHHGGRDQWCGAISFCWID